VEWIAFGNRVMCSSSKGFPILIQRYERKYGRDESNAIPRCIMAAKFISNMDTTGENTLQHWIKQGQIQDLHQVFRFFFRPYCFNHFKTLELHEFKTLELENFMRLGGINISIP